MDSMPKTVQGKFPWPGGPAIKQYFSFPDTIIFYTAMNPLSPKSYLKMIHCCKYFFEKNSILVVKRMYNDALCSNDQDECLKNENKCCIKYDIDKISSKFWITHVLDTFGENNFVSTLSTKIYRCEIVNLILYETKIMFNDLKLIATSAKNVKLWNVEVTNKDGSIVMLEDIVEALPNVEKFVYWFRNPEFTSATGKKLSQIKTLKVLSLYYAPEIFTAEDLTTMMMDHKFTHIFIGFDNDCISDEFASQLDGVVDAVIESKIPNRIILYGDIDEEKYQIMDSRSTDDMFF